MASFASLIGSQDFSGAVRLLDAEIDQSRAGYEAALHRLVQLHLNRGICNQKLQLNRKALKVGPAGLAGGGKEAVRIVQGPSIRREACGVNIHS